MIGLAKKAGRVEIGEEPVGSAARSKHARVILVASDAAAGSVRRAYAFAQTGACLCLTIPADKDALGRALGRSSCAMAAVTDVGFADAIVKKLAAMDPEDTNYYYYVLNPETSRHEFTRTYSEHQALVQKYASNG